MPTDDLSSIPGLEDKHLRALARRRITDLRGLADADRHEIYKAMENIRPGPSRERISRWQEEARRRLEAPPTDPSDCCGTLYQVGAKFELRCCGDCDCKQGDPGHLAVAGHEPQGEYMFV